MSKYLFVYGTLLPDEHPCEIADAVRKLRRVGKARARGRLYDFGDYPGAVLDASARETITGLVYEIPEEPTLLRKLDAYEGFDERHPESSLFLRKRRWVRLDDGRRQLAWVYEYNGDPSTGTHISHGDYRHRTRARRPARIAGD